MLVHEHFNISSKEHDIALLKLGKLPSPTLPLTVWLQERGWTWPPSPQSACPARTRTSLAARAPSTVGSGHWEAGLYSLLTGWGETGGDHMADTLQEVQVGGGRRGRPGRCLLGAYCGRGCLQGEDDLPQPQPGHLHDVRRWGGTGVLSGESRRPGAGLALAPGRQRWAPHRGGGRKAHPGRGGQPWSSGGVWTGEEGGR